MNAGCDLNTNLCDYEVHGISFISSSVTLGHRSMCSKYGYNSLCLFISDYGDENIIAYLQELHHKNVASLFLRKMSLLTFSCKII